MGLGECPGAPANRGHQLIKIKTRLLKYFLCFVYIYYIAGRNADTKLTVFDMIYTEII